MHSTATPRSKQVRSGNIFRMLKSDTPPKRSLAEAEYRTGMKYKRLKLAARRKHFLRAKKIVEIRATIDRPWISYRELAEICHSNWRTVKEALKYTLEEIALQLRQVFCIRALSQGTCREVGDMLDCNSPKVLPNSASLFSEQQPPGQQEKGKEQEAATNNAQTAEVRSTEAAREKSEAPAEPSEIRRGSVMTRMQRMQQRCLEIAAREQERELTLAPELPLRPQKRRDRSLWLRPEEKEAYLQRTKDPTTWENVLSRLKDIFQRKKLDNQRSNAGAYNLGGM